ncbi:DinB family protein [Priestia aryabhattai]|uniref:DinB family protein n=1 Tax=Priestia megaterium TaxID=1404 RepID=UPI0039B82618
METKTINKSIQSIQSIQASLNEILAITEDLSEETVRWNPTDEEWSILQILSHLGEAIPYWLNEVKRVVDAPGSAWGRGLQDAARLAAVTNIEELSVESAIAEVAKLKQQVASELQELDEVQLQKESPHRNFDKFGNKPVSFIIYHFIEEHIAGHCEQIKRNLSKLKK